MPEQLLLIEGSDTAFRLDRHTREIGLKGIAEARRILADLAARAAEEREAALPHAA